MIINTMSLFTATTAEEVKRLIELGHDVNSTDNSGKYILHSACENGNLDIVKVLCEAGANINNLYYDQYPIDIAAEAGHLCIVKYFIENCPANPHHALHSASVAGNTDVFDYLLTLNLTKPTFDLNSHLYNPLRGACSGGHIDIIDRLLYAGADTNIVSPYGATAMLIATINNRLDIVKKLVMFGADYHTYGGESLYFSCRSSYDEISVFLIDIGCNVNYDLYSVTPLIKACENNNLKIVKLLLERGADPNFVNDNGKKAIDYCTSDELKDLFIKN